MIRLEYLEVEEIYVGIIADLKVMSRGFLGIFCPKNQIDFIDDFDLKDCIQRENGRNNRKEASLSGKNSFSGPVSSLTPTSQAYRN
jgi:hypothetical protein